MQFLFEFTSSNDKLLLLFLKKGRKVYTVKNEAQVSSIFTILEN